MKIFEFLAIISFLLAASAGEDSYGKAIILLILAGVFAFISMINWKKVKKLGSFATRVRP